jgi:hypothetical protein
MSRMLASGSAVLLYLVTASWLRSTPIVPP